MKSIRASFKNMEMEVGKRVYLVLCSKDLGELKTSGRAKIIISSQGLSIL